MSINSCLVLVVDNPVRVIQGCKVCRNILDSGRYIVGFHIVDNGQEFHYLLGVPEDVYHCGEKKTMIMTFDSLDAAEAEVSRVVAHIEKEKSTFGLRLLNFTIVPNESKFN